MPMEPRLETERLILRLPQASDFDGYAELYGDEEAARHIGGAMPRAAAWRKFLQMPGAWAIQGYAMFSVVDKMTDEWLGQLGPWQPEGWPGTEVGWSFRRAAWGQGYATEAAVAAIDWAFEMLGWDEVIHCIDAGNLASRRVAERLGSRILRTSKMPPPFEDHGSIDVWGQSREQWRARASSR